MDISIGHLHTKYRVADRTNVALTDRLDHLLLEYFQSAYEQALYGVLGDDPRVFVLRHVQVSLSLNLDAQPDDLHVMRQWAGQLVNNTTVQIAREDPFGDHLRIYDDQAAYVSAFIADVLTDHARDAWYYPSFSPFLALGAQQALHRVLTNHTDLLYPVLVRVLDTGNLDALFSTLGEDLLADLWDNAPTAPASAAHDAILPLFLAAIQLVDSLALWADIVTDFDSLADDFTATTTPVPNWQDRRALTQVVESALRFLATRGLLRRFDRSHLAALRVQLPDALLSLDYLDTNRLSNVILDVVQDTPIPNLAINPSPSQLLTDLIALIGDAQLNRDDLASSANALRWMTLLTMRYPRWTHDPAAPMLISQLLQASAWIAQNPTPAQVLRQLSRGDLAGTLQHFPAEAANVLHRSLALGGMRALTLLVTGDTEPLPDDTPAWVETDCAGIFLLTRALLDIGFPALLARVGFAEPEALSAWLLALGSLWTGSSGGQIDAGLLLFAGLNDAAKAEALSVAWSAVESDQYRAVQDALFRQLRLLRISTTDAFKVYPLAVEDSLGWVAVDDEIGTWALADLDHEIGESRLAAWQVAMGAKMTLYSQPNEQIQASLDVLRGSTMSDPLADLTATLVATNVLRVWSRWLREFSQSSVGYLLQHFIRRKGRIHQLDKTLIVELDAQPLDIALTIAGYLDDIQPVAWLGGKIVKFRRRE